MYSPHVDNEQPELAPEVGASDLTLRQAAERAHCSVKTLRRAIDKGDLPKRYAVGENGPQLIVTPGELETWLDRRVSTPSPLDKPVSTGQVDTMDRPNLSMVSTLQAAIDQAVRSAVVPLVDELHTTQTELGDTREQLGQARARVAQLEAQLAAGQAARRHPLWMRLLRTLSSR